MERGLDVLAWHKTNDSKGKVFFQEELKDENNLVHLFNSCSKDEGFINSDGWAFLFDFYRINGVLKILKESNWFIDKKEEERGVEVIFESLMAGYDPLNQEKGDFDTVNSYFLPLNGVKRKIDWEIVSKDLDNQI